MTAIPTAGGASHAPRWVMRALLRFTVLVGLVTIGWLLGSGTGHADDDPGLPGTGVGHIVKAVSAGGASSSGIGAHPVTGSAMTRVLPALSVPRPAVQPPVRLGVLRPIVHAVGQPKPLANVLLPLSQPLPHAAAHDAASPAVAPVQPLAAALPAPSVDAVPVPPAVARAAVLTAAPVHHPAPAVPLCSPAPAVMEPMSVHTVAGHELPDGPVPLSPPASDTSACLLNSAGAGPGTKGAPDLAVQVSSVTGTLALPDGLSSPDTSGLPGSLSTQPSTSPD